MFTGFLKVGDVEIINDARAKGYAETAECPLSWHQCDCEGLADAIGSGAFVHADVGDAPWYDPRNPESKRFYGVTGLAFRDLASSTLQRDVVEGITNGGVAGQSRFAGKTIRVRAWLSADGMDALEYGMSWIKAALANRRCAQHDYSCGGTGAEFFVDCPPARAIIPDYTEWVTARTNLATNPAFRVDTTGWVGVAGGGGVVNIKRWNGAAPPEVGTTGYLRMTLATKGSWWYARHVAQPPVTARRTYTLSAWVKGTTSANGYVIVNWYDASGFWISQAFTSSPVSYTHLTLPTNREV